mgnify:CR=1 FL=1
MSLEQINILRDAIAPKEEKFKRMKDRLVSDYITSEDLNEYGYNDLGSFLNDENAFNMWYTDRFSSLNTEQKHMILKDIEMKEHRDQAILMLEDVMTEKGVDPNRLQDLQINLMDMISDD